MRMNFITFYCKTCVMFFLSGDVSNVTCAILEVPNKLEDEHFNERLRWVLW